MAQTFDLHTLGGNADSVEFCPIEGFENFLAAATYNLVAGDPPQRLGQLYLYDVDTNADGVQDAPKMRGVHEQETAGIFDLKWAPQLLDSAPCLGQASADGSLSFYSLRGEEPASLEHHSRCEVGEAMCLSLDWRPKTGEHVVVSQSNGQIASLSFSPTGATLSQSWPAHDLEVWVASFDRWDTNLIYSGADDCAMKGWDLRTDCATPVFSNRREHAMGVCTIASNPWKEHEFVSGSYDERVRVWDNRNLRRPVCLHVGAQVGGGVWRLKWHPHSAGLLLGACMHGGARIFSVADDGEVAVLEEYVAHGSLTYGADWCYHPRSRAQPPGKYASKSCSELQNAPEEKRTGRDFETSVAVHAEESVSENRTAGHHGKSSMGYATEGRSAFDSHTDCLESGEIKGDEGSSSSLAHSEGPSSDSLSGVPVKESLRTLATTKGGSGKSLRGGAHPCGLVATCSFYDRSLHLWRLDICSRGLIRS